MSNKNHTNAIFSHLLAGLALLALSFTTISCAAVEPGNEDESDISMQGSELANRTYACGYALPGYNCDNGRRSSVISAPSLRDAIAACPAFRPAGYTDSCYTLAQDGGIATDPAECSASGGSWRPGNSCCNFKGTLSCPVTRTYVCGYALPGYNCDNGRISSIINASGMSAAIAACPAARPSGYTDSCYVIDRTGGTTADSVSCAAAGGSWRPGNSCCNFKGSLSCP